jgi:hypothetical protein
MSWRSSWCNSNWFKKITSCTYLVPQGILAWVRPVETRFSAFIQNRNPGTPALDDLAARSFE